MTRGQIRVFRVIGVFAAGHPRSKHSFSTKHSDVTNPDVTKPDVKGQQ